MSQHRNINEAEVAKTFGTAGNSVVARIAKTCGFAVAVIPLFLVSLLPSSGFCADQIDRAELEFFEAKVRPILVEHCYQCHSAEADEVEAGLVLDVKAGWEKGGDSGPAIVPGDPEASLLVQAIRYDEDVISGMPPKSKLPDESIAILEKWIAHGAADPRTESATADTKEEFNLAQRVADHWSWQPIGDPPVPTPPVPTIESKPWSERAIDRFIMAKLQSAGLRPALPADKRIWIRRVYLDLIGLPPTIAQVEGFLNDESEEAHVHVVDQLLDSPHFGEKWARHWMDLVRYSETYGHEFDYPIPHAHQYRNYLIRAFNADLPYDQFVREQIAGDLLPEPRRHRELGLNESVIGTGFWYFHDATHAPTDVLANEADIISNQLDVFGKSFLGLTVACARCHDHKFDAISTADYYALSAFLQSSARQNAPLDPNGKIAKQTAQIVKLRRSADQRLRRIANESNGHPFVPEDPLTELASAAVADKLVIQTNIQENDLEQFESFDAGHLPSGWTTSGSAFQVVSDQMLTAEGDVLTPHTISSRMLGRKQHGSLRSPTFVIPSNQIHILMKATANIRVQLVIENYQMQPYNALLFRDTFFGGKNSNTEGKWAWKSLRGDVRKYVGRTAYLEFIDNGDGYVEIDQIRFADGDPTEVDETVVTNESFVAQYDADVAALSDGEIGPVVGWMIENGHWPLQQWDSELGEIVNRSQRLADQLPAPQYALAMAPGTAENGQIYIRGSHRTRGDVVPRRFLSALGGREVDRLGLADAVASPDNPLTARVIANRIWHHLFGRGIVATVDDFGPQGSSPSHPELLDHLATDLIRSGWSLKSLIRKIVLSQTYRQQSVPHPEQDVDSIATVDPTNALLHKMPVRRLSAETIRDSILLVSGRLDTTQFGPSVPTHLTSFMTGRGRPRESGPVDGNGRRSIYLAVTRNFLNPFMLTFDMPSPFGPQGRRSNSNVPAQALTLMNDPFVIEQAKRWATEILSSEGLDDTARIKRMIGQAHGIKPTPGQMEAMSAFVASQTKQYGDDSEQAWSDLAHALWNMKAFYFVY